jgi:hypothetical protein
MSVQHLRIPSYRRHQPSGLAVVTIGGRDVDLGNFDTPESRAEYDRLGAERLAMGRRPLAAGLRDRSYYQRTTLGISQPRRHLLRQEWQAYDGASQHPVGTPAREFGPLRLNPKFQGG